MTIHVFKPKYLIRLLSVIKIGNGCHKFVSLALLLAVFAMIPQERDKFVKNLNCGQSEMKETRRQSTRFRTCTFERCTQLQSVRSNPEKRHEPQKPVKTNSGTNIKSRQQWWQVIKLLAKISHLTYDQGKETKYVVPKKPVKITIPITKFRQEISYVSKRTVGVTIGIRSWLKSNS